MRRRIAGISIDERSEGSRAVAFGHRRSRSFVVASAKVARRERANVLRAMQHDVDAAAVAGDGITCIGTARAVGLRTVAIVTELGEYRPLTPMLLSSLDVASRTIIVSRTARAISTLHEHDVVHGALDLSSVCINPSTLDVRILGFGMRSVLDAAALDAGGLGNDIAPEVVHGARPTRLSDMYGFAAIASPVLPSHEMPDEWRSAIEAMGRRVASERPAVLHLAELDIAPVDSAMLTREDEVSIEAALARVRTKAARAQRTSVRSGAAWRSGVFTSLRARPRNAAAVFVGAALLSATAIIVPNLGAETSSESRDRSTSETPRLGVTSSATTTTRRVAMTITTTIASTTSMLTGSSVSVGSSTSSAIMPSATTSTPTTDAVENTTAPPTIAPTTTTLAPTTTTFRPTELWSGSVRATTNPWYAGNGGGCPIPTNRHGFPPDPYIAVKGGQVITVAASGGLTIYSNLWPSNAYPPDGRNGPAHQTALLGENGISGINAPAEGFLAGAFVGPGAMGATYNGGVNFSVLEPQRNQMFFVGDGLGQNGQQRFVVPQGATSFVLGLSDGLNGSGCPGYYLDNKGSFAVTVTRVA